MNAIIALCHFCELHGPKILYCTQTYRPQERNGLEGEEAVDGSKRMKSPSTGVFSSVSAVSVVSGDRDAPLNSPSTPSHIIHKEHVDNHAKDACEVKACYSFLSVRLDKPGYLP